MAWNDPVKYTKTLVMETSDGQVTLEGSEALALQRRLDDSGRYWHVDNGAIRTYYDINSASCGFCKVATVTSGAATAEAIPCEDPMPDCDGDGNLDNEPTGDHYAYVAVAVAAGDDPQALGLFEKDGYNYVATTDTAPVDGKTYYEKKAV